MKSIDFISESAPYRDILYSKLGQMKSRCNRPSNPEYKHYGGRGIKVCDEWNDSKYGFLAFYAWSITHGYQKGLSIDRINVNGDYEPNNCRYVTMKEQANNKRSTVWIWYNNEFTLLAEYCNIKGFDKNYYQSLRRKIKKRKISPMTLLEYPIYKETRDIVVDNMEYLPKYCERNQLDYYTVYHIIDYAYPSAKTIEEKDLQLLISRFYYPPKTIVIPPPEIKETLIKDLEIWIDYKMPLVDYCWKLHVSYRQAYNAIIEQFPYNTVIYLSSAEAKDIILNTY